MSVSDESLPAPTMRLAPALRALPRDLNLATVGIGLVAGVFGLAVSLVILNGASRAGMGAAEAASWIFGVYFFGGVATILVALVQRQPISFSWSIPGTALVLSALQGHTLPELVGAYLIVGLIVVAVSLTGLVGRIVELLPFPIVVAMIAGILMRFAIAVIGAGQAAPAVVAAALIGYFVAARITPKVPGVLVALVCGAVAAVVASRVQLAAHALDFTLPTLVWPAWSGSAIFSVAVPLALLIICAENVKGVGILMAAGYRPPANSRRGSKPGHTVKLGWRSQGG